MKWGILLVLLILSTIYDIKYRKIPNKITFPAIFSGFILAIFSNGFQGLLDSLIGFIFGLAVFIIPFMLGGIGAGDVKLMSAIGSIMGFRFVFFAALGTGVMGGVLAIFTIIIQMGFYKATLYITSIVILPLMRGLFFLTQADFFLRSQKFFQRENEMQKNVYIPYGLAISTGCVLIIFLQLINIV